MNKVYTVEGYSDAEPLAYLRIFHRKEDAQAHKREKEQEDKYIECFTVVECEVY